MSTCTFTKDGKLIAGAMQDGSIQLWKSAGPYVSVHVAKLNAKFIAFLYPFPDEIIDATLWSS